MPQYIMLTSVKALIWILVNSIKVSVLIFDLLKTSHLFTYLCIAVLWLWAAPSFDIFDGSDLDIIDLSQIVALYLASDLNLNFAATSDIFD